MATRSDAKDAYEKLRGCGHNTVDTIVQLFIDAQVIEKTKQAEDETKNLFKHVKDNSDVTQAEFTKALNDLAAKQEKSFEDLARKLEGRANTFLDALTAAAKAFSDNMNK